MMSGLKPCVFPGRIGLMDNFTIIAGLGNPGREYEGTRHNCGFDTVNILADRYRIGPFTRDGKAMTAKGTVEGNRVLLVKPLTFMNLSGEALRDLVHFYKIDTASSLIVISDDIDLPEGHLRLRSGGSAGGHNGLKNIIQNLGTDQFLRVRVGVGAKPSPDYDLADYVLGHPTGEDRKILDEAEGRAAEAVVSILTDGMDRAMNKFNTKKTK